MSSRQERPVRPPGVAGTFYPSSARVLESTLERLLPPSCQSVIGGGVRALVVPHAGYAYSGGVAATAYAELRGRTVSRVAVLCPSHQEAFDFTSVFVAGDYQTPLGTVPVDADLGLELAAHHPTIRASECGHRYAGPLTPSEHALEVQLPFLQFVLGAFTLLPIVMGNQDRRHAEALAEALTHVLDGERDLVVASSDFYHGSSYRDAWNEGRDYAETITGFDAGAFRRMGDREGASACGAGLVHAAMLAARGLGADRARVLRYATSADAGGGGDYVVGYLAGVLFREGRGGEPSRESLP